MLNILNQAIRTLDDRRVTIDVGGAGDWLHAPNIHMFWAGGQNWTSICLSIHTFIHSSIN